MGSNSEETSLAVVGIIVAVILAISALVYCLYRKYQTRKLYEETP